MRYNVFVLLTLCTLNLAAADESSDLDGSLSYEDTPEFPEATQPGFANAVKFAWTMDELLGDDLYDGGRSDDAGLYVHGTPLQPTRRRLGCMTCFYYVWMICQAAVPIGHAAAITTLGKDAWDDPSTANITVAATTAVTCPLTTRWCLPRALRSCGKLVGVVTTRFNHKLDCERRAKQD